MSVKKKQLKKQLAEERAKGVEIGIRLAFFLPVHILKNSYGWGNRKRLPRFADELTEAYKLIASGRLSLADLEKEFNESTGAKIR